MHQVEAKGILSKSNGINVYRGCSHGCIYCDSRSKCYGFDHAFEDIEVKVNAPELLEKALKSRTRRCMIGTGAMCDPYMHIEKEQQLTRKCLELIERYGFGCAIQTKSADILRDLDLLMRINEQSKTVVQMTLTTADEKLCRIIEPNVSTTRERFGVLMECKSAGIPTVVWLSPILPFINDTEENINGILDYCFEADVKGIICFGMGVTMREGNREYFYQQLDQHFPGLKERYIRTYGYSYNLASPNEARLMDLFVKRCQERGVMYNPNDCFAYMHEFPEKQLSLFEL